MSLSSIAKSSIFAVPRHPHSTHLIGDGHLIGELLLLMGDLSET